MKPELKMPSEFSAEHKIEVIDADVKAENVSSSVEMGLVKKGYLRIKSFLAGPTIDKESPLYDVQLLLLIIALMTIGLVMVTSASIPEGIKLNDDPFMFAKRHGLFLLVAITAAMIVINAPVELWQKHNGTLLMLAIFLLVAVLIVGRNVNGSTRWLGFGPINLQPAEVAKLALYVYLAGYLVRKQKEVMQKFKGFFKPMFVLFVLSFLLLLQPDLGSVVVMFVTTVGMLFLAGARLFQFVGLLVAGCSAVGLLIYVSPYRMQRITAFLDPWADPFGSGYQLTQSLMAFGRGGWFGEGLGNSVLKLDYLPEAHTDFVVAILAEETGFLGVCVILVLQMCLALKALSIAKNNLKSDRLFAGFVATGIAIWFTFQSVVNVGAAAGVLPTKGLTLPLISYGGSSLVVIAITVALLIRIDFEWRLSKRQVIKNRRRK